MRTAVLQQHIRRGSASAIGGATAATNAPLVQVPHSPEKKAPPSPSRVTLGLDKGLRGRDISLKRAPSLRTGPPIAGVTTPHTSATDDPFSAQPSQRAAAIERRGSPTRPVVKTFNQRIAEARAADNAKLAKNAAIEKSRSKGFGISLDGSADLGSGSGSTQGSTGAKLSSLEAERLGIRIEESSDNVPPTTQSRPHTSIGFTSNSATGSSTAQPSGSSSANNSFTHPSTGSTSTNSDTASGGFDSFSQIHLSSRLLPHPTLSRALTSKTIYLIPDLLKTVVSPHYEPPDIEGDWVVMGIICSKSEPRQTTRGVKSIGADGEQTGGDKYMVMALTDLKWELELFLFGGGFERFWKIGVGTVVAILNPGIMKPRNADSGKFSLALSSSEDTLLEIGHSRDLGNCKSIKRDGKQCAAWVDKRRMEHCSFHIEMGLQKSTNARMELNNMGKMFSPPKKGTLRPRTTFLGGRNGGRRVRTGGGGHSGPIKDDGLLHEGPLPDLPQRAGGAGGRVFVLPSRDSNALFDDSFADAFHNGSKEERLRRQLEKGAREREIARKLVAAQRDTGGTGMASNTGSEYLRLALEQQRLEDEAAKNPSSIPSTSFSFRRNPGQSRNNEDYTSLRSRAGDASTVSLSPIKRKRPRGPTAATHPTTTTTTTTTTASSSSSRTSSSSTPTPSSNNNIFTTHSTSSTSSRPLPTPPPKITKPTISRNSITNPNLTHHNTTTDPGPIKKKPRFHFATGGGLSTLKEESEGTTPPTGGVGRGIAGVGGNAGGGGGDDSDDGLEII